MALMYFDRSLMIYEKLGDKDGMAHLRIRIGNALFDLGKWQKAKENALIAFQLSDELKFPEKISMSAELLSKIHEHFSEWKQAYEMHTLYLQMRDSVQNSENEKASAKMQVQYEYDKVKLADSIRNAEEKKVNAALIKARDAEISSQRTRNYALYAGLFLMILFGGFMYNRFTVTRRQKSVIELQKQEVERQRNIAQLHREEIEEQKKELVDSINYAKRIQYALLAHDDLLKENLPEHFVLFRPKDIVSGDFYWATSSHVGSEYGTRSSDFYLAICDSTGHGVPGAFMSLLNISFLNEAITEKEISQPNHILDHVRNRLIGNISQDGGQDGMDAILIRFSPDRKTFTYAAAMNRPVVIRNGEVIDLPSDKMPVGKGIFSDPFQLFEPEILPGDMVYFYTDGYADQFGGAKGKKLKEANLKKKLLAIASLPANHQKEELDNSFEEWRGNLEQVDDVCVVGIRF